MPTETPLTVYLMTNQENELTKKITNKLSQAGFTFVSAYENPTIIMIADFKNDQKTKYWIQATIDSLEFGGFLILVHEKLITEHKNLFDTDSLPDWHEAKNLLLKFNRAEDVLSLIQTTLKSIEDDI